MFESLKSKSLGNYDYLVREFSTAFRDNNNTSKSLANYDYLVKEFSRAFQDYKNADVERFYKNACKLGPTINLEGKVAYLAFNYGFLVGGLIISTRFLVQDERADENNQGINSAVLKSFGSSADRAVDARQKDDKSFKTGFLQGLRTGAEMIGKPELVEVDTDYGALWSAMREAMRQSA